MLIFKKLYSSIREVRSMLAESEDLLEKKGLEEKLSALMLLYDYLHSFKWLSHEKTKSKVRFYLEHNFDAKAGAEEFHIDTVNSFETSMSYAGKKFIKRIGKKTLDLIFSGATEEALFQFKFSTGQLTLSNLLVSGVSELLPKPEKDLLLPLNDCVEELNFFRALSLVTVTNELEFLDVSKVAHIRYILESSDPDCAKEKTFIINQILNGILDSSA